jgi:hypothetical protein
MVVLGKMIQVIANFRQGIIHILRKHSFAQNLCLVLLQVPKCFGLVQIFCARQKIYLHIVAVTNILCQTKVFEEALNVVKFLGWLKKFGPAQKILGRVKEQGIIHFKSSSCKSCLIL